MKEISLGEFQRLKNTAALSDKTIWIQYSGFENVENVVVEAMSAQDLIDSCKYKGSDKHFAESVINEVSMEDLW